MCVDGVELVNHHRTLTYLRRGLGGPEWTVHLRVPLFAEGGYDPLYDDIYGADFFAPYNLACYCYQTSDPAGYVDPATDEAPWYVASKPHSAEFLGVWLDDFDDRPPVTRSIDRWASGGASVSPFVPTERTAGFTATLIATSARGMEWGRRWLTEVLTGGLCGESDEGSEIRFLPGCPDDADEETAYRRYAHCALIDPPRFQAIDETIPDCELLQARWQIAAGVPWLLSVPDIVGGIPRTLHSGESVSLALSADEWNGDVAALLQIAAGHIEASNIEVTAYPVPDGEECPIPGTPNPCHAFTIPTLAPYAVVEIDSAEEVAVYHNPTSKQPEPVWPQVVFEGPWAWLTVPPCSTVCVKVANAGGPGAVEVSLFEVAREA